VDEYGEMIRMEDGAQQGHDFPVQMEGSKGYYPDTLYLIKTSDFD